MDNTELSKRQQVYKLINTLRERSHVVEFAKKCAERAESYAARAYAYDAAAAAVTARYAARYTAYATDSAADYAAEAADYAAYATVDYATYAERDIQITHLKELHVREENSNNTLGNTV